MASTDLFEAAWYGGSPMGSGDVARLRTLADAVLAAVGRGRPGAGHGPGSDHRPGPGSTDATTSVTPR